MDTWIDEVLDLTFGDEDPILFDLFEMCVFPLFD